MSNQNLIKLVAEENHVKFRSLVNDILYGKLSEEISNKTTETLASIFDAELIEENGEKKPDADGDGVPDWADKKPGQDDNADDEDTDDDDDDDDDDGKKKLKEEKKNKKDKDEEEEDDEEDDDEEDEEEEEEEEEEDVVKKGGKSFHFDINSHNEKNGKNKNKKKDKKK